MVLKVIVSCSLCLSGSIAVRGLKGSYFALFLLAFDWIIAVGGVLE